MTLRDLSWMADICAMLKQLLSWTTVERNNIKGVLDHVAVARQVFVQIVYSTRDVALG